MGNGIASDFVRRNSTSLVTEVFKGQVSSLFQSGSNSFKALGSRTAPERVCPPIKVRSECYCI